MESPDTNQEYKEVIAACRKLYGAKMQDYGAAWHVLRPSSLTDQIYIKAKRIQTLQITGENRVGEDIQGEFVGIVNYAIMALIQLELGHEDAPLDKETALAKYDEYAGKAFALMQSKNHDYGEAWRNMRQSSLVDIILMKILRTKQIEDQADRRRSRQDLGFGRLGCQLLRYVELCGFRADSNHGGGIGSAACR